VVAKENARKKKIESCFIPGDFFVLILVLNFGYLSSSRKKSPCFDLILFISGTKHIIV
jgi:hypothetical protein